jgi:hypothetical protein
MTPTTTRLAAGCAVAVLALGLSACGGSTTTTPAAPPASAAAPAAAPSDDDTDTDATDATTSGAKVSANTASEDEIADALDAAGVSNPARWAEEVVEYRPYPADDPDLTKLRDNLAKYNPGQETTDKIVSALAP